MSRQPGELAEVRRSSIKVSRCCRSPFFTSTDRCFACKQPAESFVPWYSDDGNMMFELVSDARPQSG